MNRSVEPARARMIGRLLMQNTGWSALSGLLLFGAAGTLRWPAAWIFVIELFALGLAAGLWLIMNDRDLLETRLAAPVARIPDRWDLEILAAVFITWAGWLVLMGLDVGRFEWSRPLAGLQVTGAVCLAIYMGITAVTFRANSFASPAIEIQSSRGHHLITDGPYRYVRHPIYAASIFLYLGGSLLLGSWCGIAMAPFLVAILGVRAESEERSLRAKFESYSDYALKVPYRLVPLIW